MGTSYTTADGLVNVASASGPLYVGAVEAELIASDDWIPRLAGAELSVSGREDLNFELSLAAYSNGAMTNLNAITAVGDRNLQWAYAINDQGNYIGTDPLGMMRMCGPALAFFGFMIDLRFVFRPAHRERHVRNTIKRCFADSGRNNGRIPLRFPENEQKVPAGFGLAVAGRYKGGVKSGHARISIAKRPNYPAVKHETSHFLKPHVTAAVPRCVRSGRRCAVCPCIGRGR
ncbi:MAG TPA: hypothetical protein VMP01_10640 [Pirellulaceae bacterium]|nr:hypothetical protein [Pirellulaceae bacterium]